MVNPNLPANLFIQSTTQPVNSAELRQLDLRIDQIIRATVVEGGLDKAILEMNHQHFRAQSEKELQVGQQLKLQVLQTQPRLEFKVLNEPVNDRLAQLLPLLTRPYNWGELLSLLQQPTEQQGQSQPFTQVYSQLQQLLVPGGDSSSGINLGIAKVVAQLEQLAALPEFPAIKEGFVPQLDRLYQLPPPGFQFSAVSPVETVENILLALMQKLQAQLILFPQQKTSPMPKDWLAQTRPLLKALQQNQSSLSAVPAVQRQLLTETLLQFQAHPKVPVLLKSEVENILTQMERQTAKDVLPAEKKLDSLAEKGGEIAGTKILPVLINNAAPVVQSDKPADTYRPVNLSAEIQNLVTLVQQAQEHKTGLPPELLGRLEGLLTKLQQLPQATFKGAVVIPGLEAMLSQLTQSVNHQQVISPQGGPLGVLSQLFGFYLERELLQGKERAALASLKLGLLNLQKELGEEVAEPLRRLELFQLCKSKLAEDQVQFLPLPFAELEEGYLLAERRQQQDQGQAGDGELNLSLSLRLSALGNVRIDMLYGQQGLQLRIAGANQEKKNYLQSCSAELQTAIKTVEVKGISFSADAQLPAKQLQKRLLPESLSMLDARI
jgi:hypothetical protein